MMKNPIDIVEKVGGLILSTEYREKVSVDFQYKLADAISALMTAERNRVAAYIERHANIHNELSEQVCDEDGEKWHLEMRDQLKRLSLDIRGGIKG